VARTRSSDDAIAPGLSLRALSRTRQRRRERSFHVVVTAGPTREYLDPVRFLSNGSSGRLGYAIAAAAAGKGHRVTLISGPVELATPTGVDTIHVVSAAEMASATKRAFRTADAAVFAAAVSDYRPARRSRHKLAKHRNGWAIRVLPTVDIAAAIGRIKGRRITVGFALEDRAGRKHAEAKLRRKHFDAIILNDPSNIAADQARADVHLRGGGWTRWPLMPKRRMARRIVRLLEWLLEQERDRPRNRSSARQPEGRGSGRLAMRLTGPVFS